MAGKNSNHADGECLGVEFYVDEYWKFKVPSLGRDYDSYEEMRDGIERAQKAEAAAARRKISIDAISTNGTPIVITGVHAGHGHVVTTPKTDGYLQDCFYPNVAWIAEALRQEDALRAQANHIDAALKHVQVNPRWGYSFDVGTHGERISQIVSLHAEALKAANKTSLAELLKKTKPPGKIQL